MSGTGRKMPSDEREPVTRGTSCELLESYAKVANNLILLETYYIQFQK